MMNSINNKLKYLFLGIGGVILAIWFSACKKQTEVLPDDKENVAFNFRMASDVMSAAYSPVTATTAAYVDKYQEQKGPLFASSSHAFPNFTFGDITGLDYPYSNSGNINYVRYVAGSHRLMFTDVTNTVVFDTTINTIPKSYNCLYLADAPATSGAQAKYKLVVTEEDQKVPEGKTGVRFIHLSVDAGKITCSLKKTDGSLTTTQAGELDFGQVSPYQFFGPGEAMTDGLLRFTLSNSANKISFNTGVTFSPGKSYVVVISGFRLDQQRQIATGKNPDGSIIKQTITINSNLRADIRTSY